MNTTPEVTDDEKQMREEFAKRVNDAHGWEPPASAEECCAAETIDFEIWRAAWRACRTSPPSSPVVALVGVSDVEVKAAWAKHNQAKEAYYRVPCGYTADNLTAAEQALHKTLDDFTASRPPQAAVVMDAGGVTEARVAHLLNNKTELTKFVIAAQKNADDWLQLNREFAEYRETTLPRTQDDSAGAGVEGVQDRALDEFNSLTVDADDMSPTERLRFFCSLAMNGQDWLDSEQFFSALAAQPKDPEPGPVAVGEALRQSLMNLDPKPVSRQQFAPGNELIGTPGAGGSVGADSFNSAVADSGGVNGVEPVLSDAHIEKLYWQAKEDPDLKTVHPHILFGRMVAKAASHKLVVSANQQAAIQALNERTSATQGQDSVNCAQGEVQKDAERYRALRQFDVESYLARGKLEKLDAEVDAILAGKGEPS